MKVLMLGWEYPPHISGGLGTACEGLSRSLARAGVDIDFVVPHLFGGEYAPHMNLLDPSKASSSVDGSVDGLSGVVEKKQVQKAREIIKAQAYTETVLEILDESEVGQGANAPGGTLGANEVIRGLTPGGHKGVVRTFHVASYLKPYLNPTQWKKLSGSVPGAEPGLFARTLTETMRLIEQKDLKFIKDVLPYRVKALLPDHGGGHAEGEHYHGDLFSEVARYTAKVIAIAEHRDFDLIHAHDWMTYPAAIALKEVTGLPMVLHVHSLEFDRSGGGGNYQIEQIERAGLEAADTVIAVSYYTRSLIQSRYGIPFEKISVVHNGVYAKEVVSSYRNEGGWSSKIVLFLGRVTFQKGPDYFVEAAAKVIPHIPDVLFVMAGSGDMLPRMMNRVNELGIGANFLFTGFLKGQDVERMYSMASLYVMPSVSEPFGISPLEAISFNTPVIISKQSGVSEVLTHALKVDFWDVDQMANLIVSVLKYPELSIDIVSLAKEEIRRLRWDAAAAKTVEIYGATMATSVR